MDCNRPSLSPVLQHRRERGDPSCAWSEGTGCVTRKESLVDVVPPKGGRGLRPADRRRRRKNELPPSEDLDPPIGEIDHHAGVNAVDRHALGIHPPRDAVRPHGNLNAKPRGVTRGPETGGTEREHRPDAVHVQETETRKLWRRLRWASVNDNGVANDGGRTCRERQLATGDTRSL
jgi:hypothetical protein